MVLVSLWNFLGGLRDDGVKSWVKVKVGENPQHEIGLRNMALECLDAKANYDELVSQSGMDPTTVQRVLDSFSRSSNRASVESKVRVANLIIDTLYELDPDGE